MSASLRESLDSLDKDREFLKTGGVFTDNLIDAYISLKMDEVLQFEHTPHPLNSRCIIQSNSYLIYFFEKYLNKVCLNPD